jgi:hypothetical protein
MTNYDIEYYLYADGQYLGRVQGKLEAIGYYAFWEVNFPDTDYYEEVAISQPYNPYPEKSPT